MEITLAKLLGLLSQVPAILRLVGARTRKYPVHRAIDITADGYPSSLAPDIKASLQNWIASEEVAAVARRTASGATIPISQQLVDLFLKHSTIQGLTEELARDLVSSFLVNLQKAQLKEEDALWKLGQGVEAALDQRFDRLREEMREAVVETRVLASAPGQKGVDAAWHKRLDEGKKLAEQQKWSAALQFFRQVESEAKEDGRVGARLWYRLNANIGSSLFALGRSEEARSYFERALDYEPKDALALAQLGQVEMRLGNSEAAREYATRALAQQPLSEIAWSLRIQTSEKEIALADIPDSLREDPLILVARGLTAFRNARSEEGLDLFRRALRHGSRDPQVLIVLAESLIVQAVDEDPFGQFSRELRQEVARLSTEAVQMLEEMERSDLMSRALVARGVASLGVDDEAAMQDLRRADELVPDALPPKFHMARALLDRGRADGALYLLDSIQPGKYVAVVQSLRARALLALARTSEVELAIREALKGLDDAEDPDSLIIDLADTAIHAKLTDLAEEMLSSVDTSAVGFRLPMLRGRMEATRGEHDVARLFYEEAFESAPEDRRPAVAIEFASQLLQAGEPGEARRFFEMADATEGSDPVREAYARSLVQSEAYENAAELLATIQSEGGLADWALELGAFIALSRDDLPGATDFLGQLLARRPDDIETRIRLVYVLQRRGDWERSLEVLSPLRNQGNLDSHDLARVAQLYAFANRSADALALIYRAVRLSPDDPEIKRVFMKFFMEREADSDDFKVSQVGPDTWVRLREAGGSRTREYFIVSDKPLPGNPSEIAAMDELAQRLAGKHVGDAVTFHTKSV